MGLPVTACTTCESGPNRSCTKVRFGLEARRTAYWFPGWVRVTLPTSQEVSEVGTGYRRSGIGLPPISSVTSGGDDGCDTRRPTDRVSAPGDCQCSAMVAFESSSVADPGSLRIVQFASTS